MRAAALAVGVVLLLFGRAAAQGSTENDLGGDAQMVDRLDFLETADAFRAGRIERLAVEDAPPRLVLKADPDVFPRRGTFESAVRETSFAFTELILSYNALAPEKTGLRFDVRVRDETTSEWSPYFYLGVWGTPLGREPRLIDQKSGAVDVDVLKLKAPAVAYQVRVRLQSADLDPKTTPTLLRVAVCCTGSVADPTRRAALTEKVKAAAGWARDLKVPYRAQGDAPAAIRSEICSPTSLAMVLAFLGNDRPIVDTALAVFDPEYSIFGNWARATAHAGTQGFRSYVTRFRDWEAVKAHIAMGRPLIASIRFKAGEFPSAALSDTTGHLIVIRGFTKDGDPIVNDPGNRKKGDGAVYKADELARAWFQKGGVAYVVEK